MAEIIELEKELVMINPASLLPGTQIIYVPNHADEDKTHPDCEFGFVTSIGDNHAFCRYFFKENLGMGRTEPRTVANSEAAPFDNILVLDHMDQVYVDRWMAAIIAEEA